jgi:hypothetical protein
MRQNRPTPRTSEKCIFHINLGLFLSYAAPQTKAEGISIFARVLYTLLSMEAIRAWHQKGVYFANGFLRTQRRWWCLSNQLLLLSSSSGWINRDAFGSIYLAGFGYGRGRILRIIDIFKISGAHGNVAMSNQNPCGHINQLNVCKARARHVRMKFDAAFDADCILRVGPGLTASFKNRSENPNAGI